MHVFKTSAPQRGDIIIFLHKPMGVLFTKRVIGVGGDTVEPGQEDTILVNGKPIEQPEICGKPKVAKSPNDEPVHFDMVKVPEGSFFVIGDNIDHSLDSRTSEFGLVKPGQVRGKPLFLYWSDRKSRIGCKLR